VASPQVRNQGIVDLLVRIMLAICHRPTGGIDWWHEQRYRTAPCSTTRADRQATSPTTRPPLPGGHFVVPSNWDSQSSGRLRTIRRRCEMDHNLDWAKGAAPWASTSPGCGRDHHLKTKGGGAHSWQPKGYRWRTPPDATRVSATVS